MTKQSTNPKGSWFLSKKINFIGHEQQDDVDKRSEENIPRNIYSFRDKLTDLLTKSKNTKINTFNESNSNQTMYEKSQMQGKETVSNVLGQFMDTTSAHGFFQVKLRKTFFTKIFWICVLLIAFGGLGYHLSFLIIKYLDYGHEETTEMVVESPLFPDVTVCNIDAISADRYWDEERQIFKTVTSFWEIVDQWPELTKKAEEEGLKTFSVEDMVASPGIFANWPNDSRRLSSYQLRDLIVSCTFDGQLCNWSSFRLYEHSEFYNCYTFQMKNETYVRAGPESGLTLILFIGDQGDSFDKAFTPNSPVLGSRGWRLVVHEQNTLPAVFIDGIDILPGRSTSLALSSTKISRLPSPYSDCVEDSFIPDTDYKRTQDVCRKMCMRRAVENQCGCIPVEINPYHHPDDVYCLTYDPSDPLKIFIQKECEEKIVHDNTTKEITDKLRECEQRHCNWRCEEVEYNMQVTTSVFPTPEVMAFFYTFYIYDNPDREQLIAWKQFNDPGRFIKGENKTPEDYLYNAGLSRGTTVMTPNLTAWIAESFARVNIYFNDVTVTRKVQTPSYGLSNLLADIGGVLGLWVGVSIITIFEFISLVSELMLLPCNVQT